MELRRRVGEILDKASAGEHILIERDRKPLAVLVPYEDALRLRATPDETVNRSLAALDRLEAFARRMSDEYPAAASQPDAVQLIREERTSGHAGVG